MPWKEWDRMSLREEFARLCGAGGVALSVLCRRFGVSRKTGYKWLGRFAQGGVEGLRDQSRRPRHSPRRTYDAMELLLVELRRRHVWGGRKLRSYLLDHGVQGVPSASTITAILHRHGRIDPQESQRHEHWIRFERQEPNELWQMDYKGHVGTDAGRCHPLTVLDDHSRYCLCLDAHRTARFVDVKKSLERVFGTYGLPMQINTDNGSPFGALGQPGGLSQLGVWLIRLGITVTYSRPAHPQTNGKGERFHRTLKAELLQANHFTDHGGAQRAMDLWRSTYNFHRPHEALADKPPISRYRPSPRPYPSVLPPIEYGPEDIVRSVHTDGYIYLKGNKLNMPAGLVGMPVALRPSAQDGVWDVYFVRQKVRTLDLRVGIVT